jgi:anoctamin-10
MNETIDVGRRMIEQQKVAAQKNGQSKSPVPSMKAS